MFSSKQEILDRIDLIADVQREKVVADPVRAFEYQAAERGARAYAAHADHWRAGVPPRHRPG